MNPDQHKEESDNSSTENGIKKDLTTLNWSENVTILDLSAKGLNNFNNNTSLPANLKELNLSNNKFSEVPLIVLNLEHLDILNLSFNIIEDFDEVPKFLHSIKELNLANNRLAGPPYWIWFEFPEKLVHLDLSNNINITSMLEKEYFEEMLQCQTSLITVKMANCRLSKHLQILETFPKAKVVEIGTPDLSFSKANIIADIPFEGIDKCCDIERLIACYIHMYTINTNIDIFKNLREINLSHNNISCVPNEFCNLENLEICVLSSNNILYLPDEIGKLKKLIRLQLDCNKLCILTEDVCSLENLQVLDLYDNALYELPDSIMLVPELDLALNYIEEPEDAEYVEKKEKLRLNFPGRNDGRKIEVAQPDSEHTPDTTDDEELDSNENNFDSEYPSSSTQDKVVVEDEDSFEDWDSDEFWVPHYSRPVPPPISPWVYFVRRKIEEGNFCPMDIHPVSIGEKVKYEKTINPVIYKEVEGQFDDYSGDES